MARNPARTLVKEPDFETQKKEGFFPRLVQNFFFWGFIGGIVTWFIGAWAESLFFMHNSYFYQFFNPSSYTLIVRIVVSLVFVFLGSMVELALKRYRRVQARRAKELSALFETSAAVSSILNESELYELIVEKVSKLIESDGCIVFGYDSEKKELAPRATSLKLYQSQIMKANIPLGQGITGRAALERRPILANNTHLDPNARRMPGTPEEPTCILAAPLISGDELLGCMSVLRLSEREFKTQDLELLSLFASQASEAAYRSRLFSRFLESEERFLRFESAVTDVIYRYDNVRKEYDFISPSLEMLTGYTMEDVKEHQTDFWENLIYKDDSARVRKAYADFQARDGDSSYNLEYRIVRRSGEVICVNERGNFETDHEGRITSFNGVVRDVTEQRRAEKQRSIKARLQERLRQTKTIADCLRLGCEAVRDAGLFKRAVFTTKNEKGETTNVGYVGVDPTLVEEMSRKPPASKEVFEKILREEFRISNSYFVPQESGVSKLIDDSGRYIPQNESAGEGEDAWRPGDELLVPMLSMDGNVESFLSVDTPYAGKRPERNVILYLEDITDMVARQIHELENLAALRESEERYRQFTERAMVGVYIYSADRFLYVNPEMEKILGYSREELLGMNPWELVLREDIEGPLRQRDEAKARGEKVPPSYEMRVRRKSGETAVLEVKSDSIVYLGIEAMLGNCVDITERKRVEEALRASEELNRAIVERSPLGVSMRDTKGSLISVNESWKKIWAIPADELELDIKRPRERLEFDERDDYLKEWQDDVRKIYSEGGYLHIPEVKVLKPRPGGAEWVSHHFYALKNPQGGVRLVVVLTEDITEHKKAEDALVDSEERYRSLTEKALVGVYIFSQDNKFLYANPAVEKIFGYTEKELAAMRDPWGIVLAEDMENVVEKRARDIRDGKEVSPSYELRIRRKNGEIAVIEIKSHPINFKNKPAYLVNCIDVTERKRAEEALSREHTAFRIIAEASIHSEDIAGLCQSVISGLVEALGFDAATFRTYDAEERILNLVSHVGLREEEKKEIAYLQSIDDKRFVAALTARSRKPLIAPDVHEEKILKPYLDRLRIFSERSLISWPVSGGKGNLLGVLHLWARRRVDISSADKSFFERVSGMFAAVLERKQAEDAQRESEERYRAFTEEAMVGVYIYRDGRFLFVNKEMEKITGYSKEELIKNPPDILVLPEEEPFLKSREDAQKKGKPVPSQYTMHIRRADGRIAILELRTRPVIYEGTMAFLGNCIDVTEIRKVQEALSESEERYRVLTEEAMMGIYVASGDRFLFVNPAMEKITGYSREELMDMETSEIIMAEDLEMIKERKKHRKPGDPDQYNMNIKRKDGSKAVLEVRTRPLSREDNERVFLGNCIDVTELVMQRVQIERAKQEWERTFDSISDLVMILDSRQRIIRANRAVSEYAGTWFNKIIGKNYLEIFHLSGADARKSIPLLRIKSKFPEYFEIRDPLKNKTFSVSVAPVTDNSGDIVARVCVARDITEMRRIEEALVESEAQFRGFAESAQEIIFSLSHDGKVLYINPAIKEIFDYDPERIVGADLKAILDNFGVSATTRSTLTGNLFDEVLSEKTALFEIELEDSQKRIHVLEISAKRLPTQILGIARDITKRKRMEEQLVRASKLASIGVLAAGIAHQVNNPLAIMLATSTVLRDLITGAKDVPEALSDEASKYLDTMEMQVERTRRVVSGLLEFTQPKRGEVIPSDVNGILAEALELLAEPLALPGLDFELSLDENLPLVMVDRVALQQALVNIIQNACEAMDGKGTILLKTEAGAPDTVRVVISDNGPGIPSYIKEEIFEPLFTTKTDKKGTGLGLPVSVMLLERFGGSIRLEDTQGGGATFIVEIPVKGKESDDD